MSPSSFSAAAGSDTTAERGTSFLAVVVAERLDPKCSGTPRSPKCSAYNGFHNSLRRRATDNWLQQQHRHIVLIGVERHRPRGRFVAGLNQLRTGGCGMCAKTNRQAAAPWDAALAILVDADLVSFDLRVGVVGHVDHFLNSVISSASDITTDPPQP